MTTYYASGALWGTAGHWGTTSGASDGAVPGSGDDVIFDGTSVSMAINTLAANDTAAVCASLTSTGFGNTLTQNASETLTVSGDIAWAAGTFTGGDSTIISQTFSLTGGTWTSTSGAFEIGLPTVRAAYDSTVTPLLTSGSFTFNHSPDMGSPTGTVSLNGQGYALGTRNLSIGTAITFNNFYITGGGAGPTELGWYTTCVLAGAANIIVTGQFRFVSDGLLGSHPYNYQTHLVLHHSGGGIIEAQGNVYVDNDSTWGSFNTGATIKINGTGTQEYASPNGTGQFPHVLVDKASGTFEAADGTTVMRCTSLKLVAGTVDATGVTWGVGGSKSNDNSTSQNNPHTSNREHLAYTGGTWTGGTIELDGQGYATNTRNINIASAFTVNNFTFTGGTGLSTGFACYYVLTGAANLIVTGLLKFKENNTNVARPASTSWKVNASGGGIIEARGNLLVEHSETLAGTAAVTLSGTGDQTITETAGEWPAGAWINNNTAGVILQATEVTLGGALSTVSGSKWCMEGFDLTATSIANVGNIYTGLPAGDFDPDPVDSGNTPVASHHYGGKLATGATWNDAASWSPSGIPTSSDDVTFAGPSVSMAIDVNAACASITATGFTNTLTQNATRTLTVSGDIAWAAGTFTGGDSTIISQTFSLTGGTWTSTSVAFEIGLPTVIQGGGTTVTYLVTSGSFTFNHNSGTVSLNSFGADSNTRNLSVGSAITFSSFYLTGGAGVGSATYTGSYPVYYILTGAANIIVTGEFRLVEVKNPTRGASSALVLHGSGGGIVEAQGNVYVDSDATWGSHGSSGATIKINGTGTQEYASPNGTGHFPHIEVNKASGTFEAASGTTVFRCTSLKLVAGTVDATGVTWKVGGSKTNVTSALQNNPNGNAREHLAYTGGTWTGGTIELDGQGNGNLTRNINIASAFTVPNLSMTGGSGVGGALPNGYTLYYVLTGAANIIVTGLLKIKADNQNTGSASNSTALVLHGSGGGIVEARGNVEVDSDATWGSYASSAATIKINGTGTQEYASPNGTGQFPHVLVDKASGTFEAADGTTSIGCTSLKLAAGTVDATSVTWRVGGSKSYGSSALQNNPNGNTREHLAYTGGTWTGGTLELDGQGNGNLTRNVNIASAFTVNNFTFTGGSGASTGYYCYYVLTGAANLIVTGLLKFRENNTNATSTASTLWKVNASGGGIIEARGNLLVEHSETLAGTAAVTLSGTGVQTITHTAGEWPAGTWTVTNTDGHVIQATAVDLGAADLTTASDTRWCQEGYALATTGDVANSGTIVKTSGGVASPTITSGNAVEVGPCEAAAGGGAWAMSRLTLSFSNRKRKR